MTESINPKTRFRVAHLNPRQPTEFALAPDAPTREALAQELELIALPQLKFAGRISAIDGDAWLVEGQMDARVTQACVVTLAPVKTDLSEAVRRVFSPHTATPDGEEVEMPDDETEPLGQFIDIEAIMAEALSLALPQYPRAKGAHLDETSEDDTSEETRKPFAGLADLLKKNGN